MKHLRMKFVGKNSVIILFILILSASGIDISDYGKNESLSAQGIFNILKFIGTGNPSTLIKDGTAAMPVPATTTPKPLPICGRKMIQQNELIVKGNATKPGDWPWHAAIYKISKRRQINYICGGTLLSETRILTAGHCVVELDAAVLPERLSVVLGKYELIGSNANTQERGVFDIIVHPNFRSAPLTNDVAILKMTTKVDYTLHVQPVCLWTSSLDTKKQSLFGKFGFVVGWGFTEEDELGSELRVASLPVAPDLDCLTSNPNFFGTYLSNKTFCVGRRDGINACNGDSGGGYFFSVKQDGEDHWYIRGIVSLSVSRQDFILCNPDEYTLFSDVNEFKDFINANL